MSKNMKLTQNQILILIGLVVVLIFILAIGIMLVFFTIDRPIVRTSPTNVIAAPINSLPTATLVPTFAYLPTFTPIPTSTSFVLASPEHPTSVPQQSHSNPAPTNPPSSSSSSACEADLAYAEAMHQYYLDSIDYIHQPMINYYQQLINDALRDRDALLLQQAQQGLENEQAQVEAEKAAENKRYKAEKASIKARC